MQDTFCWAHKVVHRGLIVWQTNLDSNESLDDSFNFGGQTSLDSFVSFAIDLTLVLPSENGKKILDYNYTATVGIQLTALQLPESSS